MEAKVITRVRPFLLNSPMSAFLGALLGIGFSYILSGEFDDQWAKFYTFVVSILVSLLVAGVALVGVFANIQAQEDREHEQRRRKRMAATSRLPVILSTICDHFTLGGEASVELARNPKLKEDVSFKERTIRDLTLPHDQILQLSNVIEFHEDEAVANRIADILAKYQVERSLWQGNFSDQLVSLTPEDEKERTIGWVALYALANSLLPHSRNGEPVEEITHNSLATAFHNVSSSKLQLLVEDYQAELSRELNYLQQTLR